MDGCITTNNNKDTVPVRMAKCGGSRDVDMAVDSKIETVLQVTSSIYFPAGIRFCSNLDDMDVNFGNLMSFQH